MKNADACFLWHMRQPSSTDPVGGSARRPWVRLHATKAHFEVSQKPQIEFLAPILSTSLRRMDKGLTRPAYNCILHNSPLHEKRRDYNHWHVELATKLT